MMSALELAAKVKASAKVLALNQSRCLRSSVSVTRPHPCGNLVHGLFFRTAATTTRRRDAAGSALKALSSRDERRGQGKYDEYEDWDFGGGGGFEAEEAPRARERRSVPAEVRCFDTAKICAQSGKGGDGQVSFRREKYVPRGGPDGGNGGRGGHVWVVAAKGLNSLSSFRNKIHFRAKKGAPGQGRNCAGAAGEDVEIQVPIGTIIRKAGMGPGFSRIEGGDEHEGGGATGGFGYSDVSEVETVSFDNSEANLSELDQLGSLELLREGERKLLLHGGRGGRGNASFRSSTNKTPRLSESGEEGIEEWFELELKLVADVGIVGAPNAGKSTLLASLSNAKPKIANYPFTTLVPNLGVCDKLGYKSIVFADVPGLLEGAHTGVGLGQEFLRHCERCNVLVQVIDGDSPDPLGDFHAIRTELDLFSESLAAKDFIVAINKIDIPGVLDRTRDLQEYLTENGIELHTISAAARQGIDPLLKSVDSVLLRFTKEQEQEFGSTYGGFVEDGFGPPEDELDRASEYKKLKREADKATTRRDFSDFTLHFEGATRTWLVKGRAFESYVQMTDWQYYQAWQRFRKIIKVSGLYNALKRQGIKHGDTVCIGAQTFEWNNKMDHDLSYGEWKDYMDAETKKE
ncbi:GTP-binding protein Obg/CgtA [Chloropicon primus]|uniref:GTP-binding protein Obg/CgtA n=4 Tax=Chloropicon primus TaxID=1764295 RepID=A0A5B8MGC5_9CHLO|nr:GTP-binding protein Obg/CgtA [Chloropicon primus]UPQ97922.1 GTP-binding protein Obg/CgtA [Chloropicon primus]|eukprot:QDZ18715.1 GTP-binding protein Obg/CgtA [Chloropicon primus]